MNSICLTVFNKESILESVLDGIFINASEQFELIVCLDSCVDKSESVLTNYLGRTAAKDWLSRKLVDAKILHGTELFETRANNLCLKSAKGEYAIIIQDDDIITEPGFDTKLLRPFRQFDDVFAVTGNCAHNWIHNKESVDWFPAIDAYAMPFKWVNDRWATALTHCDHANSFETQRYGDLNNRNKFYIRDSVNRSPLAIKMNDMRELNYFDEWFKQDLDDHDLMYRAQKSLGKVCGFVNIGVDRDPLRGSTRENGKTKPWLFELFHRNSIELIRRHRDVMSRRKIEERDLS